MSTLTMNAKANMVPYIQIKQKHNTKVSLVTGAKTVWLLYDQVNQTTTVQANLATNAKAKLISNPTEWACVQINMELKDQANQALIARGHADF